MWISMPWNVRNEFMWFHWAESAWLDQELIPSTKNKAPRDVIESLKNLGNWERKRGLTNQPISEPE